MQGVNLQFYTNESKTHRGVLLYEWLLKTALDMGMSGGLATRGIAGFGKHHHMHEEHFFELGSQMPVLVRFTTSEDLAETLIEKLKSEKIGIFMSKYPVTLETL
jgi:PII-like signaling protein